MDCFSFIGKVKNYRLVFGFEQELNYVFYAGFGKINPIGMIPIFHRING